MLALIKFFALRFAYLLYIVKASILKTCLLLWSKTLEAQHLMPDYSNDSSASLTRHSPSWWMLQSYPLARKPVFLENLLLKFEYCLQEKIWDCPPLHLILFQPESSHSLKHHGLPQLLEVLTALNMHPAPYI